MMRIHLKRLVILCVAVYCIKLVINASQYEHEMQRNSAQHLSNNHWREKNEEKELNVFKGYRTAPPKNDGDIHNAFLSDDSKLNLSDYLKSYALNSNIHSSCGNVTRPKPEDITWWKNTYQQLQFQFYNRNNQPLLQNDFYIMKFYYDDRFPEVYIRGIFSIHGPGYLPRKIDENNPIWQWAWAIYGTPWYVYFWYKKSENPLLVKCYLKTSGGVDRVVGGTVYSEHAITCSVPNIDMLPSHASVITSPFCSAPKTLIEIVYPTPADINSNQRIGVCMASMYGMLTQKDVPYFVNWMETLHTFGVSEVTMNNASLHINDSVVYDVINYYKNIGRLEMTHYPPVHTSWEQEETDAATEAINKMTTGNCFYRNLKRYWYTLIIDIDEIPVPTYHDTYQKFLLENFEKHPTHIYDHSLGMRSSFFYLNFPAGNPEYKEHLPVLRNTKHFRIEPIKVDGIGVAKSFHNNRNVIASGHHQARATYPDNAELRHTFLDVSEISIHHYRKECKWTSDCADHVNETVIDDILPQKFGTKIQDKVEFILHKIGYNYS